MRSKLFVPGSRPELFAKALAGAADSISFDVEDSVPENSKAYAREQIADFLRSGAVRDSAKATGKLMIVRINALGSPHFQGDLMAFACPQVALLNLPKAQSAADVRQAAVALESAERRNGVERPLGLLVNIETPRALRLAPELAAAHPRVAGLQLGLATRRANSAGVSIGVATAIVVTVAAWWNDLVHPYFYLGISIFVCIVVGYVASLFFPAPTRSLAGLTVYKDA